MNRVYLSGMFSHKERIKQYAEELAELGIEPTSTWVGEEAHPHVQASELPDHYLRATAILDIKDMLRSNTLVLFTPSDAELEEVAKRSLSRGGRNFETGFFYALVMFASYLPLNVSPKKEVIVCGVREGVFHWLFDLFGPESSVAGIHLPTIRQFDTFEEVKLYLTEGVKGVEKFKTAKVESETKTGTITVIG